MTQQANLQAATRTETGKGAARSLRREGKVPGVIYGHGRPAEALTIETSALTKMLAGISASTTIFDIVVDGRAPVKALIREMQRDPLRPADILHLDLYEVRADEVVTLEVPVHLVGIPDGVRNFGGVLDHVLRELEIEVLPANIPERVELDVTALAIGHSVFVRDVTIPNAKILNDPDTPIATVVAPRTEEAPAVVEEPVSTEPELIRKPKPEAEGEPEPESLTPARDRWAGQPRPGVRRNPAQRRVSTGRSSRATLARGTVPPRGARAGSAGHVGGARRARAEAADLHEPERRRAGAAPRARRIRSRHGICLISRRRGHSPRHLSAAWRRVGGGHNGLKSIEGALQRQDYARSRSASGRCPPMRPTWPISCSAASRPGECAQRSTRCSTRWPTQSRAG